MPTEVIATPRADQQIAGLDRTHARAFGEFLDDLAAGVARRSATG